ncbi:MAG: hydrogenase [Desulfovibrio sp.]|jgi:hydrogenase-4 component E|nr:hydrogenase [Desulfovibrio sp.]MBI4958950.1 hydrogenase [Desulfovibrio sp.]
MDNYLNGILVLVLVLNLLSLGTSRINTIIKAVSVQGALLGVIPFVVHQHLTLPAIIVAVMAIALKGVVIPLVMVHALREAQIKREIEPMIGLMPSIILGAVATAFSLLFASQLPLASEHVGKLLVPTAIATVFTGFIVLITRYKALTQVVGYLILENGIYIFGMLLIEAMPFIVELGVLLDLFVGIFVICIIANHINQAFSSMDTRRLVTLKE